MHGVREFASELVSFASTDGNEAAVATWFAAELDELGFETYEWAVDAALLASHPSFPDDPAAIASDDRRSVGGVLEFGDPAEPVVCAAQSGMRANGLDDTEPRGVTYGANARHYVEAGIPTVLFGPGSIEQAHFPDETIDFRAVGTAVDVLADAAAELLAEGE